MPVPARPEKLLEATYGPGWRVPDPAFKFTTPDRTIRAFDDWFRGTPAGDPALAAARPRSAREPLARTRRRAGEAGRRGRAALGAEVLDVGAGRGADSLWLARQGHRRHGVRLRPRAPRARPRERAASESLDLDVRYLNLTEWRSVLAEGARLAAPSAAAGRPGAATSSTRRPSVGRESLARLCSMALREGGRLFAEFHVAAEDRSAARSGWSGEPDAEALTTLLRDAGASRVDVEVAVSARAGRSCD